MKSPLDPRQQIHDLIRAKDICSLATCGPDPSGAVRPHLSLMAYLPAPGETPDSLYLLTFRHTRKFANLTANPPVSVLIDTREEDAGSARAHAHALTIAARAEAVENPAEADALRAAFVARHGRLAEFAAKPDVAVIRVVFEEFLLLTGAEAAVTLRA